MIEKDCRCTGRVWKDELHQFLRSPAVCADRIKHSGRSLYQHLCGTAKLLEHWGNCNCVCIAGLFHSIYGTNAFQHQSWPTSDRHTIELLIGPTAEALVHIFCTVDRPRAWFVDPPLQYKWLRALREIEVANLIDQGSRSKWFKLLLETDISEHARQAIRNHMALLPEPKKKEGAPDGLSAN